MGNELKQRKVVVQRKRTRPTESSLPEEVRMIYLCLPILVRIILHFYLSI